MTRYEVRYDADTKTYMVLELITDDGGGNRYWEILDECDTEYDARVVLRAIVRAEKEEIYAEWG